jgi:hypothetical protein
MFDGPVVERGVLTTSAQMRDAAARRAEVIERLARRPGRTPLLRFATRFYRATSSAIF